MKTIHSGFLVFLFLTFFSGCYTIVWDPMSMDFPNKETSSEYSNYYYDENYYGNYYNYYNTSWWHYITPPSVIQIDKTKNPSLETFRDDGGGRGTPPRRDTPTINLPEAPPPSVSQPDPASNSSGSTSGSSSNERAKDSSRQEESTKKESSNSNDSRQMRNDGNRSSDPKRR